ncbi:MAG: hypothetical protein DRG36_00090 [Deltaproteobacteria bacterium]|nr:MAG: hypothetical protein DRG36_00090 [Deltaproteobacteria bacterium]RLA86379.1 MAG: hypothetical protein DRG40_03020 [Deltaproteobacteria bacterium]RLA98469.1 MAG: hypothetical protein DRG32_01335 [Deltaproteobacteria bacterium]
MSFSIFYIENILHTYQRQLRTEQDQKPLRSAHERRSLLGEVRDRVSISAEAKRRQIVSRFASQVVDEVTK